MFEILGFLLAIFLNGWFTLFVIFNLLHGGGDLGPLLTGWINWKTKVVGIVLVILVIYFWYLIFLYSPFLLVRV